MEVGCLDFWETGFLQALFNLYNELLRWVLVLNAAERAVSGDPIEVRTFSETFGGLLKSLSKFFGGV
ncbi:hypothetical protein ACFX13_030639 [Malus domestica]